ncbi:hypothetical protein M5K25_026671 [Dendrobium thyrsiflorum]|uniref:VQ domain-containing protein n=1 Tax=Dendrobium thyrsiflorum TaxID=117978 RepID=A0ABD0TXX4_DENTH
MVGVHSTLIFISPLFYFKPFQTPVPTHLSLSLPFPSFSSSSHLLSSTSTNFASAMNPSREIYGIRNSPLKLNKVSNDLIKKPTSSSSTTITSTSSTTSSSSSVSSASHRPPVIIYTHSPKIIHTRACDFMALVQKLTGFSRSSIDDSNNPAPSSPNNDDTAPLNKKRKISIEKKKEELREPSLDEILQLSPQQRPSVTPATANFEFNPPPSDVPLFMQGFTSEFFDLPNAIYKYPELPGSSPLPNINGATSTFSEI